MSIHYKSYICYISGYIHIFCFSFVCHQSCDYCSSLVRDTTPSIALTDSPSINTLSEFVLHCLVLLKIFPFGLVSLSLITFSCTIIMSALVRVSLVFFPCLHIIVTNRSFIKILPPSFFYPLVMDIADCQSAFIPARQCIEICFISFICILHSSQQLKFMGLFNSLSLFLRIFLVSYRLFFLILSVYSRSPTEILIRALFMSYTFI